MAFIFEFASDAFLDWLAIWFGSSFIADGEFNVLLIEALPNYLDISYPHPNPGAIIYSAYVTLLL